MKESCLILLKYLHFLNVLRLTLLFTTLYGYVFVKKLLKSWLKIAADGEKDV